MRGLQDLHACSLRSLSSPRRVIGPLDALALHGSNISPKLIRIKLVFFMFEQAARFVGLSCLGLASGMALCVLLVQRVGTDDGQFYTQLMQIMSRALTVPGPALGAFGLIAMVTDATLLYMRSGGIALWLVGAAILLSLVALALTKFGHFPINDRILGWVPTKPPADWRAVQSQWSALHMGRTICATGSFALLVLSNLLRR